MEEKKILIEELFEQTKDFVETKIALIKLKAIAKASEIFSSLISRLIIVMAIIMSIIFLSIGIAIYLGNVMGELYCGFLTVGAFYLVLVLVLLLISPSLKKQIGNSIISAILK